MGKESIKKLQGYTVGIFWFVEQELPYSGITLKN